MVFGGITDDICKITVKGQVKYYKRIHVLEFDSGESAAHETVQEYDLLKLLVALSKFSFSLRSCLECVYMLVGIELCSLRNVSHLSKLGSTRILDACSPWRFPLSSRVLHLSSDPVPISM